MQLVVDLIDYKRMKISGLAMAKEEFVDEFGFYGPLPISSAQRTIPKRGFPPGLAAGELAPNFCLKNQFGDLIDFHADRGNSKAALLFFRSVVW